jgi:hypothetical protein
MGRLGRKKEIISPNEFYCDFGNWIAKYCQQYSLAKVDLNHQLGISYSRCGLLARWLQRSSNTWAYRVVSTILPVIQSFSVGIIGRGYVDIPRDG